MKAVRIYHSPEMVAKIKQHLWSLPLNDRYMRFFAALSDESIGRYVDKIDLDSTKGEAGFGLFTENGETMVGFCHVAPMDDSGKKSAELALSVSETHRRNGYGRILFNRGVLHCESHGIKRLYMNCLSSNTTMQRMAHDAGMSAIKSYGDIVASLDMKNDRSVQATLEAINNDSTALYDLNCKPMTDQWIDFIGRLTGKQH